MTDSESRTIADGSAGRRPDFDEAEAKRGTSAQFIVRLRAPETADATRDPRLDDPVFAALAKPALPPLQDRDRAWLQIQSPRRLFFYWSLKSDPRAALDSAFGGSSSRYGAIVKLVNLTRGTEQMHHAPHDGDWWFDAEPDCRYRAEVGFHAESRPYVRAVFSNTVSTPRRSPSPRPASESEWAVSAERFAEVLEHAGFKADAVEVAIAGDDAGLAAERTRRAARALMGDGVALEGIDLEELRYAMLLLASGLTVEEIRGRVGDALYRLLLAHLAALPEKRVFDALVDNFDIVEKDGGPEETFGPVVWGASLLHMPRTVRGRRGRLVPRGLPGTEGPSPEGSHTAIRR
jgi:hypothetical protein